MKTQGGLEQQTVLVVDDDPIILDSVHDLLVVSGYDVLTATDGKEGLEILEEKTPDIIISDIMMKMVDGYMFFHTVRNIPGLSDIPFVFLTARNQGSDVILGAKMSVDYYITKPFEPEELLSAITTFLDEE